MTSLFMYIAKCWQTMSGTMPDRGPPRFGLQRILDLTLLNPDRPYEACDATAIQYCRQTPGFEPATRTLVRSNHAGHSVQIFLLREASRTETPEIHRRQVPEGVRAVLPVLIT